MSKAMTTLRLALERQNRVEKNVEEGVEIYLNYLEEYVNEDATMSSVQADTLMDDIVQWHEDPSTEKGSGFLYVATYINSCR